MKKNKNKIKGIKTSKREINITKEQKEIDTVKDKLVDLEWSPHNILLSIFIYKNLRNVSLSKNKYKL